MRYNIYYKYSHNIIYGKFFCNKRAWALKEVRIRSFFVALDLSSRFGKESFCIIDTDILSCFFAQAFEESIISMVNHAYFMEISDDVRSYQNSRRKPLGKLYPIRIWLCIFTNNFVKDNPRIVNMETRVLKQEPLNHLFIKGGVYSTGHSAVAKYHFYPGKFP